MILRIFLFFYAFVMTFIAIRIFIIDDIEAKAIETLELRLIKTDNSEADFETIEKLSQLILKFKSIKSKILIIFNLTKWTFKQFYNE